MRNILVVDDEPDITAVIKKGLEQYDLNVQTFTDPVLALAKFTPGVYDLAILDIKMPKINGFELFREIKKRDDKIKVLFFTAFEEYRSEFNKAFPEVDPKRFLKKPLRIADLAQRVTTNLRTEEAVAQEISLRKD